MKVGTLHHPKMKRFAKLLGVPSYSAVGLLESLWHLAAEAAAEGDIGRFSAEEIADYVGWEGDAEQLMQALVDSRWVDQPKDGPAKIHDWLDHAPKFILERFKKQKQRAAKKAKANKPELEPIGDNPGTSEGPTQDKVGTDSGQSGDGPLYSPSHPVPSSPVNSIPTATWESVEEELAGIGMSKRASAIEGAKRRDLAPEQAQALIDHFKSMPGAYAPGALFGMLTGELAEWPPPKESYLRDQAKRAESSKRQAESTRRDENSRRLAEESARYEELEAKYGNELEALDGDGVIELLRDANPSNPEFMIRRYRRNGLKGDVRSQLIYHLAGRNGVAT